MLYPLKYKFYFPKCRAPSANPINNFYYHKTDYANMYFTHDLATVNNGQLELTMTIKANLK